MQNLEETLARWRIARVRQVPLAKIVRDPAFQPRDPEAVAPPRRSSFAYESSEHIAGMMRTLSAAADAALEPVLIADVDGVLTLCDGFHRVAAYERFGRQQVPARVLTMPRQHALYATKLVNVEPRSMKMRPEQTMEAMWQFLAALSRNGQGPLPVGTSLRSVAARFNASHNTPSQMMLSMRTLKLSDFSREHCDSGTGFPFWRAVQAQRRGEWAPVGSLEEAQRAQGERFAVKLADLWGATPEPVREFGLQALQRDLGTDIVRHLRGSLEALALADAQMQPAPDARALCALPDDGESDF